MANYKPFNCDACGILTHRTGPGQKRCLDCQRGFLAEKNRRNHEANAESIRARKRKHHWNNRPAILLRKRARRDANKDALNEKARQWRLDHPEEALARDAKFRAENPGVPKLQQGSRTARKYNCLDLRRAFPRDWMETMLEHQGQKCPRCGCGISETNCDMAHIKALSLGGEHSPANSMLLCGTCNGEMYLDDTDYRTPEHIAWATQITDEHIKARYGVWAMMGY